jgi:hypothetical protein
MLSDTAESLTAYYRENDRVCPVPTRWSDFWQLLPDKVQIGAGWKPPLPLILAAWHHASNLEKMLRLGDHIKWAAEHGVLDQASAFLRGLKEDEWHHLKD